MLLFILIKTIRKQYIKIVETASVCTLRGKPVPLNDDAEKHKDALAFHSTNDAEIFFHTNQLSITCVI